jgi:hypothetical protein
MDKGYNTFPLGSSKTKANKQVYTISQLNSKQKAITKGEG